jgi:cell division protein FtsI (penicillin-binding protein 3)
VNIRSLPLLALLSACGAAVPAPAPVPVPDDGAVVRAVDAELTTLLAVPGVRSARVVVLDPRDGRILAIDALDAAGRHDASLPAIEVRAHGSTAKTITAAAALAHRSMTLEETVDGASYEIEGTRIEDASVHGPMTLGDAMAFSSNVAFSHVYERVGREALLSTFTALHLGHRIPEAARTSELAAARFAFGGGIEMTTVELATAYAAIANGGELHAPWRSGETPSPAERVLDPDVAADVMALLEGTVTREDGTATEARIEGLRVAGKTGTASVGEDATFGVFAGILPADAPRLVVVVAAEIEGHGYSGGTIAAPAFARIGAAIVSE